MNKPTIPTVELREKREVDILGEKYSIVFTNEKDEPRLNGVDGFCDSSVKKIVVDDFSDLNNPLAKEDLSRQIKAVVRHEIVHAFLHESGLDGCSDWAANEELVDWIALQGLKFYKAWKEAGAVDD